MNRRRRLLGGSLALAVTLSVAACGDGSSTDTTAAPATSAVSVTTAAPTTTPPTTTAAPTTTAPTTIAPATTAAASADRFPPGSPEAAVAAAFRTVFDSSLGFDAKAEHLEDAAALEGTIAAYTTAAARFGGFKLEPTAVTVTGTTADVVYDVFFGTARQYGDQKGTATLVGDTWQISRAEFCSFMGAARNPCPA